MLWGCVWIKKFAIIKQELQGKEYVGMLMRFLKKCFGIYQFSSWIIDEKDFANQKSDLSVFSKFNYVQSICFLIKNKQMILDFFGLMRKPIINKCNSLWFFKGGNLLYVFLFI